MKKSKKFLISLLASVLAVSNVATLASCGGGGGGGTQNIAIEAYNGGKVTVRFYHCMGANLQAVLNKYKDEFNKIYPNITIEHSSFGDYPGVLSQISDEIMGGNSPSMAYCYSDHVAKYNKSKMVATLDEFIDSTLEVTLEDGSKTIMGLTAEQKADYVETYFDEGKVFGDGKMYSLPFAKSSEVLYYNKDYFEANNYTVPKTWDEMEQLCKTIDEKENKIDPATGKKIVKTIPLGYDSEANWFITMCEQQGSAYTSATGDKFLFNNEANWAMVERFKSWYDKGYVTTEELNGGYTSDLFTAPATEVRSYMTIGSSAGASYQNPDAQEGTGKTYDFEVGIAMIPQESTDPAKAKVISQGPSVCLFKTNPQEMAASWLFMKFLTTSVEFQAQFSMRSGYSPVIKSVENNSVYQNFIAKADGNQYLQASCVKQTLAQKSALFVSPAFHGSADARVEVGKIMQQAFSNKPAAGQSMTDFIKGYFNKAINQLEYDFS